MDISECTKIVFDKIQRFDPENCSKIIEYLLLKDQTGQEIIQLASVPDSYIHEIALMAKTELQKCPTKSLTFPNPFQLHSPSYYSFHNGNTNPEFMTTGNLDSIAEHQTRDALFGSDKYDHEDKDVDTVNSTEHNYNFYLQCFAMFNRKNGYCKRFPFKTCHYFSKGYCRHGNSCKFYHHENVVAEISSLIDRNDASVNDEQEISPGSLAQLETEIVELLKQRGSPISIASLPMAYYEKYKKVLQAEGYLAESQRHGKFGHNLTKLLSRFKNRIRLIDRPHGQHFVVLAKDAPKFMGKIDCKNISASQQIYLTFPADSTFSEEDVSNYFSKFGQVEDVRIPCQQRRMFGFVTFVSPETVKKILDKRNPHFVRDSTVLVKPYKEKPKPIDRKYPYRLEHHVCYSPRHVGTDAEINSFPISCLTHRYLRRWSIEEQERFFEMERRRLETLQIAQKPFSTPPHLGINMNASRASDDHFNVHPIESLTYARNNKSDYINVNNSEDGSYEGLNLPDVLSFMS